MTVRVLSLDTHARIVLDPKQSRYSKGVSRRQYSTSYGETADKIKVCPECHGWGRYESCFDCGNNGFLKEGVHY